MLPRKEWSTINLIRTGRGRYRSLVFKWHNKNSAECNCGGNGTDHKYIVEMCAKRQFKEETIGTHRVIQEAIE